MVVERQRRGRLRERTFCPGACEPDRAGRIERHRGVQVTGPGTGGPDDIARRPARVVAVDLALVLGVPDAGHDLELAIEDVRNPGQLAEHGVRVDLRGMEALLVDEGEIHERRAGAGRQIHADVRARVLAAVLL